MNREWVCWIGIGLFVCAVLALFAPCAEAGPPLICWPFEIGDGQTLPWAGHEWRAAKADYDLRRLPDDTLALLAPGTPVIVRMETLRRATVYAMKDRAIAGELLARLQARVREAESKGKSDALALFDAGYLIASYRQAGEVWRLPNPAGGRDGLEMIEQAIRLRGRDAEMEFAAALAGTDKTRGSEVEAHLEKAVSGAAEASLLARNLLTHCHLFGKRAGTLAELRAQLNSSKVRGESRGQSPR
jgi:hypothetical protein